MPVCQWTFQSTKSYWILSFYLIHLWLECLFLFEIWKKLCFKKPFDVLGNGQVWLKYQSSPLINLSCHSKQQNMMKLFLILFHEKCVVFYLEQNEGWTQDTWTYFDKWCGQSSSEQWREERSWLVSIHIQWSIFQSWRWDLLECKGDQFKDWLHKCQYHAHGE